MKAKTFFYQGCPVCGRNLRIPVSCFGRRMSCTHCQGEFAAGKDELPACPPKTAAAAPHVTAEVSLAAANSALVN